METYKMGIDPYEPEEYNGSDAELAIQSPKSTTMFCGKCEKKVDGMHQLFCDPVNRYANPYLCKQCLEEKKMAEMRRCEDPVYFYENYFTVDGKPPAELNDYQKGIMRELLKTREEKGIVIVHKRSRSNL